jgi:hypothetical protein
MIPVELQMVGFPTSLIEILLSGGLTNSLKLTFSSPLMAGRAKRGLYRLKRHYNIRTFKISQPDPCTLVLKPITDEKFTTAAVQEWQGHDYHPSSIEDLIRMVTAEDADLDSNKGNGE